MHFISVLGDYEGWPRFSGGDGRPIHPPQIRPHQSRLRQDDGQDLQEGEGHPHVGRQDGHRGTFNTIKVIFVLF
jgi:hypothetical protein